MFEFRLRDLSFLTLDARNSFSLNVSHVLSCLAEHGSIVNALSEGETENAHHQLLIILKFFCQREGLTTVSFYRLAQNGWVEFYFLGNSALTTTRGPHLSDQNQDEVVAVRVRSYRA